MLQYYRNKRMAFITFVYWFLFCYIVAALAWWYIELWQMNRSMFIAKKDMLSTSDPAYEQKLNELLKERERKNGQFASEGITFLGVTILAAGFVYRSVRRQIKLNAQQQNFMMAVTHELKTPIAVTKLNLETLRKHKLDPEQTGKIISNTLHETNRLNDLCDNILLSSQLEAGGVQFSSEDIRVDELTNLTVKEFSQRFQKRVIEIKSSDSVMVHGDSLLLRLAINNLVENALKYSASDQPVVVNVHKSGDECIITVEDRGSGIPDAEKKKVFDKFYRIGDESTRHTKGTGLGLFLSKKIITDHGGSLRVQDSIAGGSIFVIQLPIKK